MATASPVDLAVFGADGGVGRRIVDQALERGHAVRAIVRHPAPSIPHHDRLTIRVADVLADPLEPVIDGAGAVVSALGVARGLRNAIDPPPVYSRGTARMVSAMRACAIRRLVVISAAFVSRRPPGPLWFHLAAQPALAAVFHQMRAMEDVLAGASDIDWTAVRPAWLLDREPSGDPMIQPDTLPRIVFRTRQGDLASFMLDCALGSDWIRQTPAIGRRESEMLESPLALLDELG